MSEEEDGKSATTIEINIRQANSQNFTISIETTATITEMKAKCEEPTGLKADQIRLIFKGRILKDLDTVDKYNIVNESAVHLVKSSAAAAAAAQPAQATAEAAQQPAGAAPGGMGGLGAMGGLGGMGGMGGIPGMAAGGGASGMQGMNVNPQQIQQMM